MAEQETLRLLTWMATNRDPYFLENVIYALKRLTKRDVSVVYYLYGGKKEDRLELKNILKDVAAYFKDKDVCIEPIDVGEFDASSHSEVLESLVKVLEPRRHEMGDVCVNISSGTPTMSTVWMILKTMQFFGNKATFYDAQKYSPKIKRHSEVLPKEKQKIAKIDFEIKNTLVSFLNAPKKLNSGDALLGRNTRSPAYQKALNKISKYSVVSGVPIFLLGERGVGKSNMVKYVIKELKHKSNLVEETCGSWDSSLADDMIFGHRKNAFTDAKSERIGCLARANNGILFLDEIQDLPRIVQRKLLRTIQEPKHPYKVLGDDQESFTNAEFVFASNNSIEELRKKLDPDFFDRISFYTVEIPPLRKRKEDIQDDWENIWKMCRANNKNVPEKAPWNTDIQKFFADDVNLQGNMRSLQAVAYHIMAWEAWDDSNKICDVLNDLAESNRLKYEADMQIAGVNAPSKDFAVSDFTEFQEGSWKNSEKKFKIALATWAKQKYGTWEKAAQALDCTKETLMKAGK